MKSSLSDYISVLFKLTGFFGKKSISRPLWLTGCEGEGGVKIDFWGFKPWFWRNGITLNRNRVFKKVGLGQCEA